MSARVVTDSYAMLLEDSASEQNTSQNGSARRSQRYLLGKSIARLTQHDIETMSTAELTEIVRIAASIEACPKRFFTSPPNGSIDSLKSLVLECREMCLKQSYANTRSEPASSQKTEPTD